MYLSNKRSGMKNWLMALLLILVGGGIQSCSELSTHPKNEAIDISSILRINEDENDRLMLYLNGLEAKEIIIYETYLDEDENFESAVFIEVKDGKKISDKSREQKVKIGEKLANVVDESLLDEFHTIRVLFYTHESPDTFQMDYVDKQ